MRSFFLFLATALLAAASYGQQEAQRDPFPSDYTPSACAPANPCESFNPAVIPSAGGKFLGFDIDVRWLAAHDAEIRSAFEPYCRQLATCLATKNNNSMFCDDLVSAKARATTCNTLFPNSKHDNDLCAQFLEVYWLGVDQRTMQLWRTAQACAAKQPAVAHAKPPIIWMTPSALPVDYPDNVQFFALDPDTHVPLQADITFEDQIFYAPANPAGKASTYYPMKLPIKYIRVPNADGHTDAVPPIVTINTPDYPPVSFRLNAKVPSVHVEMTPGVPSLHPGANDVTVVAKDDSGKAIDARVMVGNDEIGYTNQPIKMTLPEGKRPEIWVKPFLDRYSDVVIAKAE
jgi:hypothetical protein